MKTFYLILWIVALIAWIVSAFNLMITEMWIANIFMWILLIGKKVETNAKYKTYGSKNYFTTTKSYPD